MWPCSMGGVRDGGCGHAVWEGSGMEGVAMQCGRADVRVEPTCVSIIFSSIQPRL